MKKHLLFSPACIFFTQLVLAQVASPLELDPHIKPITSANGKNVKVMKVTCADERSQDGLTPRCNTTEFHFDKRGRLVTEKQFGFTGEKGRTRHFSYDSLSGNLVRVQDSVEATGPGQYLVKTITYAYDTVFRTITETTSALVTSGFAQTKAVIISCYGPDGKVNCVKSKLEYEKDTLRDTLIYDVNGRLNLKITKGRDRIKYKYSKDGRLIEKISGSEYQGSRWRCDYNDFGLVTCVKQYLWEVKYLERNPKPVRSEQLHFTWNYSYEYH